MDALARGMDPDEAFSGRSGAAAGGGGQATYKFKGDNAFKMFDEMVSCSLYSV